MSIVNVFHHISRICLNIGNWFYVCFHGFYSSQPQCWSPGGCGGSKDDCGQFVDLVHDHDQVLEWQVVLFELVAVDHGWQDVRFGDADLLPQYL